MQISNTHDSQSQGIEKLLNFYRFIQDFSNYLIRKCSYDMVKDKKKVSSRQHFCIVPSPHTYFFGPSHLGYCGDIKACQDSTTYKLKKHFFSHIYKKKTRKNLKNERSDMTIFFNTMKTNCFHHLFLELIVSNEKEFCSALPHTHFVALATQSIRFYGADIQPKVKTRVTKKIAKIRFQRTLTRVYATNMAPQHCCFGHIKQTV